MEVTIVDGNTHGRENNHVLSVALRTVDSLQSVSFLFFIYPSLQAGFMNPASSSSAFARLYPQRSRIVFFRGKTHPAVPPFQGTKVHDNGLCNMLIIHLLVILEITSYI